MSTAKVVVSESTGRPDLWISGILGGALALAGVLVLFGIAGLLALPLRAGGGPPDWSALVPLTLAQAIPVVIVAALGATALYALLRRIFKGHASRIFQVIALLVLLLSFGGPLSLAVSTVNKLFLALMHLVAAAAIVWALTLRQ